MRCANGASATVDTRPLTTGRARTRAGVGGDALARLAEDDWPSASVVSGVFGRWAAARKAAEGEHATVVPDRSGRLALD
jgi:hypothetical protein